METVFTKPGTLHPREHTTEQEIKFIDELGLFSKANGSRRFLLLSYLGACNKRTNWGALDKAKVIHHARMSLAETTKPEICDIFLADALI